MTAFGGGTYEQARTRARAQRLGQVIEANRPRGHWDRVRRAIARRTGRVNRRSYPLHPKLAAACISSAPVRSAVGGRSRMR